MASNINTTDIDETYPVAGQDNDSQGFRNNFNTIKSNFVAAKSEIEDLQNTTAKLDETNDFNGNNIQEANFIACSEEVAGPQASPSDISFVNGSYQIVSVGANQIINITKSGWPASGTLGKMRVEITSDSSRIVTWVASNGGTIKTDSSDAWDGDNFTATTVTKIIDFWTTDAGATVYAHYVGDFS